MACVLTGLSNCLNVGADTQVPGWIFMPFTNTENRSRKEAGLRRQCWIWIGAHEKSDAQGTITRQRCCLSLDCFNSYHRVSDLKANIYFSEFWNLGSPRWRCQQILCLWEPISSFIVSYSFHCVLKWQKKQKNKNRDLSGVSFIRAWIPFMRTPASWLNQIPKALPLQYHHIEGEFFN